MRRRCIPVVKDGFDFGKYLRALSPYDRHWFDYNLWIKDDDWSWQYRLIHNAPGEEW